MASVGIEVIVGSRSKERAAEVCGTLLGAWPDRDLPIEPGDNSMASGAEIVVVATPWDAAASTALTCSELLEGKVVISMANALARVGKEFQALVPPRGSVAAHIQSTIPGAMVSAAFHHLPARELAAIDEPMKADVLVCSDHAEATATTTDLIARIPGLRALDTGSLSNAGPIEAMTAVLLQLNGKYKTRVSIQVSGIE
jgi:8-hydroxy-5-deazaflavin:NADPH oxidoreductase